MNTYTIIQESKETELQTIRTTFTKLIPSTSIQPKTKTNPITEEIHKLK
jgi:hypothetical protein